MYFNLNLSIQVITEEQLHSWLRVDMIKYFCFNARDPQVPVSSLKTEWDKCSFSKIISVTFIYRIMQACHMCLWFMIFSHLLIQTITMGHNFRKYVGFLVLLQDSQYHLAFIPCKWSTFGMKSWWFSHCSVIWENISTPALLSQQHCWCWNVIKSWCHY